MPADWWELFVRDYAAQYCETFETHVHPMLQVAGLVVLDKILCGEDEGPSWWTSVMIATEGEHDMVGFMGLGLSRRRRRRPWPIRLAWRLTLIQDDSEPCEVDYELASIAKPFLPSDPPAAFRCMGDWLKSLDYAGLGQKIPALMVY
jgi:hypothetical protein